MSYIDIISETQISISDNIHFPWFYFFTFIISFRGLENSTFSSPNVTAITGRDVHVNEERNVYF